MRCIWCGYKYTEEFEELSAGFCSSLCLRKWEDSFENLCKQLSVDKKVTIETPDLKCIAG
jgi:hypothetical protein